MLHLQIVSPLRLLLSAFKCWKIVQFLTFFLKGTLVFLRLEIEIRVTYHSPSFRSCVTDKFSN
ncbi:hypothetical protein HanXRQr2_Chr10g0464461 [Helianthus annuus]|uniref:Uncharacterized protein n=1 Tax=Helianthus annuus TaxID=4232 RepID=A0A9K3N6D7_HELAN|nr:hypothetical protein HanXRQr2_Chr10g0464461 [Helianthus annuus]